MKKQFLLFLLSTLAVSACSGGGSGGGGGGNTPSKGDYSFFETMNEANDKLAEFFSKGYKLTVNTVSASLTQNLNADKNDFPHLKDDDGYYAKYYFEEGNFARIDLLSSLESPLFVYKHDTNHSLLDFGDLYGYGGKAISEGREMVLLESMHPEYYTHKKENGVWTREKDQGSGSRFSYDYKRLSLDAPLHKDGFYTVDHYPSENYFAFSFLNVSVVEFKDAWGRYNFEQNDEQWFDTQTGIFTEKTTYGHLINEGRRYDYLNDATLYTLVDDYVNDEKVGTSTHVFTDKISYQLDKEKNFLGFSFYAAISRSYDFTDSDFFHLVYEPIEESVEMPVGDTHSYRATEGGLIGNALYGTNFTAEYTIQTYDNRSSKTSYGVPSKEYRETNRLYSTNGKLLYELEKYDSTSSSVTHSHEFKLHSNGKVYENAFDNGVLYPYQWEDVTSSGDVNDYGLLRTLFFEWYNEHFITAAGLYQRLAVASKFDEYNKVIWLDKESDDDYGKCIDGLLTELYLNGYMDKSYIDVMGDNSKYSSFEFTLIIKDVGTTVIPEFADMNYTATLDDHGAWLI